LDSKREPVARILIIDDEAGMREGCRRVLVGAGYGVDSAADLKTGQELAHAGSYELYLLDVMLPDGSGLDLIDPILEQDPEAIFIIITGFGSVEVAVEAVRRGAYDFLSKPFTSDELLVAVGKGLERRKLKAIEARTEELVQAKAELEQLDAVKSQLMLKVAHELRAPVAAVQSYINLMLTGYIPTDEINPTLVRVQERLQEMLDLTSDLLELAQLKQAKEHVFAEASPQQMAEILTGVCRSFQEQAQEKRQSLQVEIREHPVLVADEDHLKQIWTNLISNAIKYTPEGGRIDVSLEADEERVIGRVADSGIGIAEEDMANLFQEFYRTEQAKATGEIGTGLGLSIVKQIVESYGGEIEVASRLGRGSCFTFVLPLRPTSAERNEQPLVSGPRSARRPIDDETLAQPTILGEE
jgi:signal transduction histidine kinase